MWHPRRGGGRSDTSGNAIIGKLSNDPPDSGRLSSPPPLIPVFILQELTVIDNFQLSE